MVPRVRSPACVRISVRSSFRRRQPRGTGGDCDGNDADECGLRSAIFDIPATLGHLDKGVGKHARVSGPRQAMTDFARFGYGGPCPPKGHGEHRYRFHLLALDVATLALPEKAHCRDVERTAAASILSEAVLVGTYSR